MNSKVNDQTLHINLKNNCLLSCLETANIDVWMCSQQSVTPHPTVNDYEWLSSTGLSIFKIDDINWERALNSQQRSLDMEPETEQFHQMPLRYHGDCQQLTYRNNTALLLQVSMLDLSLCTWGFGLWIEAMNLTKVSRICCLLKKHEISTGNSWMPGCSATMIASISLLGCCKTPRSCDHKG